MKTLKLFIILVVYLLILWSCSDDDTPEPLQDCYQIAKQLEKEQFEAYQNYATVSEIQEIRERYIEEYPFCRWD